MNFNSVENIVNLGAAAAFTTSGANVFREQLDSAPVRISERVQYMPWGADNMMPFDIINLIESDETLATCQMFNSEVCYGAGLRYAPGSAIPPVAERAREFAELNSLSELFLGSCQDFKFFGFAVSVIILSNDGKRICSVRRKEACYCRFAPADENGNIPFVHYANWRLAVASEDMVESIPLLNRFAPAADLEQRIASGSKIRKFAVVSRIPTVDATYYPIPYYAALFKGRWFSIKQLVALAKEAKLKNSAPLKYQIEISSRYWNNIFQSEGITDKVKQMERVVKEKHNILDFLTGAENSGKVLFSTFYSSPDGKEQHDVVINKIDVNKEGGEWSTDIQEAINVVCFTMRVHSNLVGSVPGKAQSNNSGSDKRELFTIAQALQKPYHDILFNVHRLIIRFNGWVGVVPEIPFLMLTTLDKHADALPAAAL